MVMASSLSECAHSIMSNIDSVHNYIHICVFPGTGPAGLL